MGVGGPAFTMARKYAEVEKSDGRAPGLMAEQHFATKRAGPSVTMGGAARPQTIEDAPGTSHGVFVLPFIIFTQGMIEEHSHGCCRSMHALSAHLYPSGGVRDSGDSGGGALSAHLYPRGWPASICC
jgi:hypothetical protein